MSKKPTMPEGPEEGLQSPPVPVRVPIEHCVGKTITCPECGSQAYVTDSRGGRSPTQVLSSQWWFRCRCEGTCGAKLRKAGTMVSVLSESLPKPKVEMLARAVGKWVGCPLEGCGLRSRAGYSTEHGHDVTCPEHGTVPHPGGLTMVELAWD